MPSNKSDQMHGNDDIANHYAWSRVRMEIVQSRRKLSADHTAAHDANLRVECRHGLYKIVGKKSFTALDTISFDDAMPCTLHLLAARNRTLLSIASEII